MIPNSKKNISLSIQKTEKASFFYERVPQMEAESQFPRAVDLWKKSKHKSDAYMSALYKQATTGDVKGERPTGMFAAKDKAAFDNHAKLKGMTGAEAKVEFVHKATEKGILDSKS